MLSTSGLSMARLIGCLVVWCVAIVVSESSLAQEVAAQRLRILTYNIHHGEGMDGKFDYERLAKIISRFEPDLVAIQEVDRGTRRSSGVDQAARLAELTGMHHAFGNALYYQGGEYGEAILSRWPISNPQAHPLPFHPGLEPRTALAVRVKPDNGIPEIVFVGTHLCHQDESTRTEQTTQLQTLFGDLKHPVIVAGDLNARPSTPPMKVLWEADWVDTVAPRSVIDYVLVRRRDPWRVVQVDIGDEPVASDHPPVLVELEWRGEVADPEVQGRDEKDSNVKNPTR